MGNEITGIHIAMDKIAENDSVFIDDTDFWQRIKKSDVTPDMNVIFEM